MSQKSISEETLKPNSELNIRPIFAPKVSTEARILGPEEGKGWRWGTEGNAM